MFRPRPRPGIYLFVLWSEARREEDRIVADLGAHFTVLDAVEVAWTAGETFARNLTRMYGDALPPGSEKEVHCGSGPFLAVIVEDRRPRYRIRRTAQGLKLQNSSILDARHRYRMWTRGGYRVHASDSVAETGRNLALLFGMRTVEFRHRRPSVGGVRRWNSDPVGTNGWDSLGQLVLALEVHGGRIQKASRTSEPSIVRTSDVWWAEHIAGGREISPGTREVLVGGESLKLTIVQTRSWTARVLGYRRRVERLCKLVDVKWSYPRPVTTLAVAAVAASCTVVARSLLPRTWRPERLSWVALASPGTYLVLRLGAHTGWSKRFKHTVLDWFGGDVDDAQTWMLGILSSGGILAVVQITRRGLRSVNSAVGHDASRGRVASS